MAPLPAVDEALMQVGRAAPWLTPALGAVLGAVAGSFINCARHRLPRGLSLWNPPSHCPGCKRTLGVTDLVPVVSWLALRGRCRSCGHAIGASSLWHEVAATMAGGLAGWAIGLRWFTFPALLGLLIIYAALVLISHRRLSKTPAKPR